MDQNTIACFVRRNLTKLGKLKTHEKIHNEYSSYKCEFCDNICSNGFSLKKHLRIHNIRKT